MRPAETRRRMGAALVAGLALWFGASSPVQATTLRLPSIEELATRADAVIHGEVVRVGSRVRRRGATVEMEFSANVRVIETWAGRVMASSEEVRLPAGVYPGGERIVRGAPILREGERLVLFLRDDEPAAARRVLGMGLGVFRILGDDASTARARREVTDAHIVGVGDAYREELSLTELRERVRRAREADRELER